MIAFESAGVEFTNGDQPGVRLAKRNGNRNENDIHRDRGAGFGGMSGAVLPVLLAVGVSVCVFVVVWWLVGKL